MQKKIFCLFGRWDILSYLMFKSKRQVLNYYSIQKQRFGDWFYPCDRWSVSTWEELFVFLSFSNMTQKVWRSKLNWEKKKDIQLNNSDLKNMPEFYVIESSIKRGDTLVSRIQTMHVFYEAAALVIHITIALLSVITVFVSRICCAQPYSSDHVHN